MQTVFFGGGTPTLLPPADLTAILHAIDSELGLAAGVEVTAEANPETVDERALAELRAGGFTRISLGMQSAVPHVLAVLDRVHQPGRPEQCVAWARAAGFGQVSLDLIYGTPGESDADWETSLDRALAAGPDHISAYSLIVEDGTRLAARIRRGELPMPDDDVLADRYLMADARLAAAGLQLVRGVELGSERAVGVPAQPAVLDGRGLVGDRARRAQPRRRHALVERQAPGGLRAADHRRPESWPGTGGADRRRAGDRADHAGDQAGVGLPGAGAQPGRAVCRSPGGSRRPG